MLKLQCTLYTCILIALAVAGLICYGTTEIMRILHIEPRKAEDKEWKEKYLSLWIGSVSAAFFVEIFLIYAIYYIRKKIASCRHIQHQLNRRNSLQEAETEELEMQSSVEEETPRDSEPGTWRPFSVAYDPSRLDSLAVRIRRAGDNMDRDSIRTHHYASVPSEEVERY